MPPFQANGNLEYRSNIRTYTLRTRAVGEAATLPFEGNMFTVRSASGKITVKAVGDVTNVEADIDRVYYFEKPFGQNTLAFSSSFLNDSIKVDVGFGFVFPTIPTSTINVTSTVQMANIQDGSLHDLGTADNVSLLESARELWSSTNFLITGTPLDVVLVGSATPGGITAAFKTLTFQLKGGATTPVQVLGRTTGDDTTLVPLQIYREDGTPFDNPNGITDDGIYRCNVTGIVKIRFTGGSVAPGANLSYALTEIGNDLINEKVTVIGFQNFTFNTNGVKSTIVDRPNGAIGATFHFEGAFDPGNVFTCNMYDINPVTGNPGPATLVFSGTISSPRIDSFAPSGWFNALASATAQPGTLPARFRIDLSDSNAGVSPDTACSLVICWLYA